MALGFGARAEDSNGGAFSVLPVWLSVGNEEGTEEWGAGACAGGRVGETAGEWLERAVSPGAEEMAELGRWEWPVAVRACARETRRWRRSLGEGIRAE